MLPKNKGLKSNEALKRLKEYGPNKLPEKPPPSNLYIFVAQLKNPLVYILIVAGLVTFLLNHVSDTIIIGFAVFINTILGFFQERKANRALHALKQLIHPQAEVIRDGKKQTIEVEDVVPGDVIILNQGTKVPADGKIIDSNRLYIDEAILTGESVAVRKKKTDGIYMGTVVASGRGAMIVETTGARTEIGKIAEKVQVPDQDTPLKKQLRSLSSQLSILVLGLTAFVLVIGFIKGRPLIDIFTTSVALAVSSIPEGLLVALTVVLAIGMQRILKRKGLVRNLLSAETLGGVTTICVDKTGTLTEGSMRVTAVMGDKKDLMTQAILANDLDDPIVIAAYKWAKKRAGKHNIDSAGLIKKHTRLDSIPFSSKKRFFVSLNKWNDHNNMIFVNGAPEFLLDWSILPKGKAKEILSEIKKHTEQGRRVIGFARKKTVIKKKSVSSQDVTKGLHWVGLLVFSDPVRAGVKTALQKTKSAGIDLIVITGDYPQTAISVMDQLGISVQKNEVILGSDLKGLSLEALSKKLIDKKIALFARTTPEQKLRIVEGLKHNGEVVAMMGDGVNDAPALKRADIGVVVGDASDVAKETADLVLLNSSFTTVIAAIEEGRGIFTNIRKVILYLMSDAFEEIIAVVGTLLLGLPLPVTAAQILWINLISDGFPDLALTVDPKSKGIMNQSPRPSTEPLVTGWMKAIIGITSLIGGIIALSLFVYYFSTTQDLVLARSIAFASLGVNSLLFVFTIRTLTEPFWRENPFKNKWLNIAVIVGFIFQFLPFSSSSLRKFFGLTFPGYQPIMVVFASSIFTILMIEFMKIFIRKSKL